MFTKAKTSPKIRSTSLRSFIRWHLKYAEWPEGVVPTREDKLDGVAWELGFPSSRNIAELNFDKTRVHVYEDGSAEIIHEVLKK